MDFATYENGKHRIDSVLISHDFTPLVKSVRYTPGGLLCTTDHKAVLLKFETRSLFDSNNNPMTAPAHRGVKSRDRSAVTTFVEKMHAHLLAQNAFERGKSLDPQNTMYVELVETLDTLVGEAGNIGERKGHPRRPLWYSNKLAITRRKVSLLRHYVNGRKANIDQSQSIQERLLQLNCDIKNWLPRQKMQNQRDAKN